MAKIGFIGAGNMAGAIVGGVINWGLYSPCDIGLYDVSEEKREHYTAQGHPFYHSAEELVAACDIIVLSVKPQVFPAVLPEVKKAMTAEKLLCSIAAGITAQYIQSEIGFPCKVVLVMPNTPLLLGAGAAALARVEPTTQAEFDAVKALFSAAGIAEEVTPAQMNATIPIHGSGPAFLYQFAKTIVEEAEKAGIAPDVANRLFCQMLVGSARMMTESGMTHAELIKMVCSPGGTTLAALDAMEKAGYSASISAGYEACIRRAIELSK
jgi:pyrroline-5-carboxylate reductase